MTIDLIDNSEPKMNSPEYAARVIKAKITANRIFVSGHLESELLRVATKALEDIAADIGDVGKRARAALEELNSLLLDRKKEA